MHPTFREVALHDHRRKLERTMRTAQLVREAATPAVAAPAESSVVLRLCRVCDEQALGRLAGFDGRPAPKGPHVVAEVDDQVVAALPLGPGEPLADPFRPTAHLLPLLELRAKQLTDDRARRRPLAALLEVRRWSRA